MNNIKSAFNFAECNLVPASLLVGSPEAFGLSSRLYDTLAADWEVLITGWLFLYGSVVKQMLYQRQERDYCIILRYVRICHSYFSYWYGLIVSKYLIVSLYITMYS